MPPTRLKYDGLPEGAHTFTYVEKLVTFMACPLHGKRPDAETTLCQLAGPNELYCGKKLASQEELRIIDQPRVDKGDVVEVDDLNDPKSERARICRGHVERGVAHVLEEKKKPAAKSGA